MRFGCPKFQGATGIIGSVDGNGIHTDRAKVEFVITDGGSNQEECYYMGKPCIIMRATSERQEGLGENAIISNYEYPVIEQAIQNFREHEASEQAFDISPSDIIIDHLVQMDA